MTAPPKPWEQVPVNQRQSTFCPDNTNSFSSATPHHFAAGGGGGGGGGGALPTRPPIPPRPQYTINTATQYPRIGYGGYGSYNSYGGGYSPYGGLSYGGYGRIGGGSMYGIGDADGDTNGFVQIAEESSRQAFQSIESIVHAFGSVSMMLESTYHAVYSSFRAVLGVAEHFSRMKSHFGQIFSALAAVRTLRWLYRKLLYLIGLRSQDPSVEAMWRSAAGTAGLSGSAQVTEADLKASRSSWPIIMFMGVVFGGPYLIWRLLSSLAPQVAKKSKDWMTGKGDHHVAEALYDFQARAKPELSFRCGQKLAIAPRDQQPQVRGWILASNGRELGIIPANFVKIIGFVKTEKQDENSMATTKESLPRVKDIPAMPKLGGNSVEGRHVHPSHLASFASAPAPRDLAAPSTSGFVSSAPHSAITPPTSAGAVQAPDSSKSEVITPTHTQPVLDPSFVGSNQVGVGETCASIHRDIPVGDNEQQYSTNVYPDNDLASEDDEEDIEEYDLEEDHA